MNETMSHTAALFKRAKRLETIWLSSEEYQINEISIQ
jgi:hypothetical protein